MSDIKGTVNLSKGAVVDLSKNNTTKFFVGANWGMQEIAQEPTGGFFGLFKKTTVRKESLDFDLSAVALDAKGKKVKVIYYENYRHRPITGMDHSGDDLDGDDEDDNIDNEIISVDTTKLPSNVAKIVFILNVFTSGVDFHSTPFSRIRLYKGSMDKAEDVIAQFKVDDDAKFAGKRVMLLGELEKSGSKWSFKALGDVTDDTSLNAAINTVVELNK